MTETARDQLNGFLHGADQALWSTRVGNLGATTMIYASHMSGRIGR
jgi:hypothetical protein